MLIGFQRLEAIITEDGSATSSGPTWRYFITVTDMQQTFSRGKSMCVWERTRLKGNYGSSLFPISSQSEQTLVQFHPPSSFHHPQPQLIGVPDHCHMHSGLIAAWVCAWMYIYIHLWRVVVVVGGVKEMFLASATIKRLTPHLVSDYQIAKCLPYGLSISHRSSLAHVLAWPQSSHSHPTTKTPWHIAHTWMTSCLLMFFRPFSKIWNTDWRACLLSIHPQICLLGKKKMHFCCIVTKEILGFNHWLSWFDNHYINPAAIKSGSCRGRRVWNMLKWFGAGRMQVCECVCIHKTYKMSTTSSKSIKCQLHPLNLKMIIQANHSLWLCIVLHLDFSFLWHPQVSAGVHNNNNKMWTL